jgi:molecular chaperone DnaK (HSP70)
LSEDEIARMVKEAEENAEADKVQRERVEAKVRLESYLYSLRTTVDDTLKDKLDASGKEEITKAVSSGLSWLEEHPTESKESYDEKIKEVEAIANPIIAKVYQSTGGTPPSGSPDGPETPPDNDAGPTVEEVD